jgi:hypothetical protein
MRHSQHLGAGFQACCLAGLLALCMATSAIAQSSNYEWKYFSTNGTTIYPYYGNDNDWGYANTDGSGFMEMYKGQEWGWYSPKHNLPTVVYALPATNVSFASSFGVNSGGRIDECMDDFVQATNPPNSGIQGWEIMVWSYYQGTQPIASSYNAQGVANPWKTNVNIGGVNYNVYNTSSSGRYGTTTFIRTSQTTSYSLNFTNYVDWCANNGVGFNYDDYLESIGCGWEWANGWANCYSLSISD